MPAWRHLPGSRLWVQPPLLPGLCTSMCVTQILPVLLHPQAWLYPAYPAMGIKRVPDSSSASSSGNWHCSVLTCFLARYLKEMSTGHVCLSISLSSSTNSSVFFWFNFFHIDQERSQRQCQQGGRKALPHPRNTSSTLVQDIRAALPRERQRNPWPG